MAEGTQRTLFGETGSSLADLLDIMLGLNGRNPDYNLSLPDIAPGFGTPDFDQLLRNRLTMAWDRLVPGIAIDAGDLAGWLARYRADRSEFRPIVTGILQSASYADDADTLKPKSTQQFLRGLYMDVFGSTPDAETVREAERAFTAMGDPTPGQGQIVIQLLASPEADDATPEAAGLDVDDWVQTSFLRTLGRLPTPAELTSFRDYLIQDPSALTDWALEAMLTSDEYLYY